MIYLKVFIAYESKYGNGKKCVEKLQSLISKEEHNVEVHSVREIDPNSLPQADLYIFSSPTQIGRPARKMRKFLKKLEIPQGAKYSVMVTHMDPNAKTLRFMEDLLQSKGMTKVSDGLKLE